MFGLSAVRPGWSTSPFAMKDAERLKAQCPMVATECRLEATMLHLAMCTSRRTWRSHGRRRRSLRHRWRALLRSRCLPHRHSPHRPALHARRTPRRKKVTPLLHCTCRTSAAAGDESQACSQTVSGRVAFTIPAHTRFDRLVARQRHCLGAFGVPPSVVPGVPPSVMAGVPPLVRRCCRYRLTTSAGCCGRADGPDLRRPRRRSLRT